MRELPEPEKNVPYRGYLALQNLDPDWAPVIRALYEYKNDKTRPSVLIDSNSGLDVSGILTATYIAPRETYEGSWIHSLINTIHVSLLRLEQEGIVETDSIHGSRLTEKAHGGLRAHLVSGN
jgi:hypothetical protein